MQNVSSDIYLVLSHAVLESFLREAQCWFILLWGHLPHSRMLVLYWCLVLLVWNLLQLLCLWCLLVPLVVVMLVFFSNTAVHSSWGLNFRCPLKGLAILALCKQSCPGWHMLDCQLEDCYFGEEHTCEIDAFDHESMHWLDFHFHSFNATTLLEWWCLAQDVTCLFHLPCSVVAAEWQGR